MKKNNPKIAYDKESRVLSIEIINKKSADSDIQGNVVIDYDSRGRIVRMNLYNFNFSFEKFRNGVSALRHFARDSRIALR